VESKGDGGFTSKLGIYIFDFFRLERIQEKRKCVKQRFILAMWTSDLSLKRVFRRETGL
jgi:hypothetical protein